MIKKSLILIITGSTILIIITLLYFIFSNKKEPIVGLINPWINCDGLDQAESISGINFSTDLDPSKYKIRTMRGMVEIQYNIDEDRVVIIRKTKKLKTDNIKIELSGVYDNYPVSKDIKLSDEVLLKIETDTHGMIYLAYFSNNSGYYSLYCNKGLSLKEVENIYNKLKQKKIDYSNCELGDLVGEDVVRSYFKGFYLDYHSSDYTELQVKELAQKCLDENIHSQYEMDCCLTSKMFPETY